jgi:hypothetical protein
VSQFIDKHKDVERIPEQEIKAMATKARCYSDLCYEVLGLKQVKNPKTRDAQIVSEILNQVGIKIDNKRDRKKQAYERSINKESLVVCEAYHRHKLRQKAEREAKAQAEHEAKAQAKLEVLSVASTSEASKAAATTEELSTLERLWESLRYCQTQQDFSLVLEGFQATPDQIEDAIMMQDTQPRRLQLSQWYDELIAKPETSTPNDEITTQAFIFTIGQKLKGLRGTITGKIAQVTESFGDWCETTLGSITAEEIQSGAWSLV